MSRFDPAEDAASGDRDARSRRSFGSAADWQGAGDDWPLEAFNVKAFRKRGDRSGEPGPSARSRPRSRPQSWLGPTPDRDDSRTQKWEQTWRQIRAQLPDPGGRLGRLARAGQHQQGKGHDGKATELHQGAHPDVGHAAPAQFAAVPVRSKTNQGTKRRRQQGQRGAPQASSGERGGCGGVRTAAFRLVSSTRRESVSRIC